MHLSHNRRNFMKGSAALMASSVSLSSALADTKPSTKTLKVALIGCGGRGSGAASQILKADNNIELIALADVFPDKVDAAKKRFARLKDKAPIKDEFCFSGFDAYKKIMEIPEVDIVLLTTPPHFRPMHIEAAVDAGKHVFAEKPLACDPAGLKRAAEAIRKCEEKGLYFLCGFCYRFDGAKVETMKQIKEGIIGDITNIQSSYNAGGLWHKGRKDTWTDMEWQMRNWLYFTWLSGDHIVEQAIHGIDKMQWLTGDADIKSVNSIGGRQSRTDAKFGDIFDHFSVQYEFDNGIIGNFTCRQQSGTDRYVGDVAYGTKGKVDFQRGRIYNQKGEQIWAVKGKFEQMHQHEQRVLVEHIRAGKYFNNGKESIKSCGLGILGRMSGYTGKKLTWDKLMNSKEDLSPSAYSFDTPISVPPVAQPGITKFV
ncbi:Gfo/Idh/MocA family oxidoreductase [Lentisphaera profundi]|uniref:Gfo/Idh/MocA family oxidoreductase n=1 Tax=Lentisphaera profundi TaxID=1658616 RepID=A0ABY7VU98_9BACT|nr:Gfo/Idh/MocA family oxidoreductase [Lentisphaera profundi]WDE97637.1 Gfo/Idh/MocA family oxidoreductase [Lentisphaera profundi]